MKEGRDVRYSDVRDGLSTECDPEIMNAEDPLFILYTSGSTGKPKGVVHTTGGYAVWAATTFDWIFDYRPDDIFWCTADIGWITGHTYVVYGPLMMRATSVMFDGVPNYPDFGRFWETVDRLGVTIFYTAPTAIRALDARGRRAGEALQPQVDPAARHGRRADQSRSVGMVLARGRRRPLPGGRHLVADRDRRDPDLALPRRDADEARIGDQAAAGRQAVLVDAEHERSRRRGERQPLPCLLLARPDAHRLGRPRAASSRPISRPIPALYFTGDGCRRDEDGYYWITGRVDDVINVSGHRIGTAEVESSLVSHPKVAEAAVVGLPARDQGPGDLRLRDAQRRRGRRRRVAQGAGPGSAPRHRRVRRAREDPLHAGASQDPLGQDHAADPPQDRRGRDRRLRRHLDAGRSDVVDACWRAGNEAAAFAAFALVAAASPAQAGVQPGRILPRQDPRRGHAQDHLPVAQAHDVDSEGCAEKDGSLVLKQIIHEPASRRERATGGCSQTGARPLRRHAHRRREPGAASTSTKRGIRIRYHGQGPSQLRPDADSRQCARKFATRCSVKRFGIIVAHFDETIRKLD